MTQPYNLLPRIGSSMAEEWQDIGLAHHVAGRFPEAEQAYQGLRLINDARLVEAWMAEHLAAPPERAAAVESPAEPEALAEACAG